jgi:hypothetical protein
VTLCSQAANTGFADLSNLNLPAGLKADVCGPVRSSSPFGGS